MKLTKLACLQRRKHSGSMSKMSDPVIWQPLTQTAEAATERLQRFRMSHRQTQSLRCSQGARWKGAPRCAGGTEGVAADAWAAETLVL